MYMGTIPDHFNEQAANAIDFAFVLAFGEETMITILALGNCIVVVHYHYVQCPNIVI